MFFIFFSFSTIEKDTFIKIQTGSAVEVYVFGIYKNGKIYYPTFKNEKNQNIKQIKFFKGAGGSGRYGYNFELDGKQRTITQYSYDEKHCTAESYKWDNKSKVFKYDKKSSIAKSRDYCGKICKSFKEILNFCK